MHSASLKNDILKASAVAPSQYVQGSPSNIVVASVDELHCCASTDVAFNPKTHKVNDRIKKVRIILFISIPTNCYAKFDGFFRDAVFALDGFIKLFADGL